MIEHPSGLSRWSDTADFMAACVRIMVDPAFDEAAFALAANMLAAADHDRVLDAVFRDAGRYVAAMCAFQLQCVGALTLPRLKSVCAASGLLSPGKARALLLLLHDRGYFRRLASESPRGPAHYVATDEFILAWGAHLTAALAAARLVEPDAERLLSRMNQIPVLTAFGQAHVALLLSGTGYERLPLEIMTSFVHANAGSQVLYALFEAGEDRTAFPPRRCTPVTLGGLAARFGVSRPHVKRMFDRAAQGGLGVYGRGAFALTDKAADQLRFFFALQILALLASAAAAERNLQALG
jgi:hypothetical protein